MWMISAAVALAALIMVAAVVKLIVSGNSSQRKREVKMITLVKPPPPPPKVEEKPPEPEPEKEEMIEPEMEEVVPEENSQDEAPPPGDDLALDADGSSGSDGFGLKAKKGGRPLIGGDGGKGGFGWYTARLTNEIQRQVNRIIQKKGGVPDEKFESLVRLVLDDEGTVVSFDILDSSGNDHVDDAIREALAMASAGDPPPIGMPRQLKVRISPNS